MELQKYRELLFKIALEKGCQAAQTRFDSADMFDVDILNGEIDRFSSSKEQTLKLNVQLNGKVGYASTEVFEDAEELVKRAMDNAAIIEIDDDCPMQPKSSYREITPVKDTLVSLSESEKIALAMELEKCILAMDERVQRVGACSLNTGRKRLELHNTLGLEAISENELSAIFVEPIMKQGEDVKNSFAWRTGKKPVDIKELAREAIDETLIQFDASPVPSGEYRILLRNNVVGDLLDAFNSIFSADDAQKGLSLLKDREGETIASEKLTIMDDPFYPGLMHAFDFEGVPAKTKAIVENGVLKTLLHNLKTAKKAGVESTGNGTGSSVSPTNMYIVPGEHSYDELVERLGDGLIITDLSGLHAGVNAVSGDFSLLARGQLVEGGKIVRSVDQITVAGSFYELMKSVEFIGNDTKESLSFGGMGTMIAPSIIITKLSVAG